jgi:hypothetical protein
VSPNRRLGGAAVGAAPPLLDVASVGSSGRCKQVQDDSLLSDLSGAVTAG